MRRGWRLAALFALAAVVAAAVLAAVWGLPPWNADSGVESPPPRRPAKPNIVMIMVDSLRAESMSCYGYARPTTPFIDQLAADGVRFENYFANSSWTAPTVMSAFTGLSSIRHGRIGVADQPSGEFPTVAGVLKSAGYHTLAVTCNAVAGSQYGYERGFDLFDDYSMIQELMEKAPAESEGGGPNALVAAAQAVDERLAVFALKHLEEIPAGEPYFLFIQLFDPHWEYYPLDEYKAMFVDSEYAGEVDGSYWALRDKGPDGHHLKTDADLRRFIDLYDAEIRQCDDAIKGLVEALRASGRLKDTDLLIVTADHGEEFMEHDVLSHGKNLYEQGVKVPLVMTAPAWLPRGTVTAALASHVDYLPTLAKLGGAEVPEGLPGADLLAFRGGRWTPPGRDAVFMHVDLDDTGARPMIAARSRGAKVIRYLDTNDTCAFSLVGDPGEERPLAVAGTPEFERLLTALDGWYAEEKRLAGIK